MGVTCKSHVEFTSIDRVIKHEIAHTSTKYKQVSKDSCFLAWKRMFCMAGQFFCSSGAQFHGKHGCSWNVIAQRATLQDFKSWRFLLFKRRWEKVGVERECASLLFREANNQTRMCFLDFTLPEQVNTYVFPHRDIKSDCKRLCVEDVLPHSSTSIHMALKNLDMWDVFPQKHGNAHVYPHENTKMARERDCVSSSHHHRAWKRVCVKNVVFCASPRLKSVAVFLRQAHPNRWFCQKLLTFRDQKLRKRHAVGKTELPKIAWQLQKKNYKFYSQKRYKRYI